MEGRRRYPRIPSQNAVLVKRLDEDVPSEGFVKTRVVGLGGCMWLCDEALGVDSYLDVLIRVRSTVVQATGKVVYETPLQDGRFEVGVEFVKISDTDRRLLEVLWSLPDPAPCKDLAAP
jgi:hypothetical protein